jgi:hypothetical protein
MARKKTFDFDEQLKIGNRGEKLFLELYPKVKKEDGRIYDFSLDGKTIELKTDTYSMDDTPNFFMEHLSDVNTGRLGGPWRALEDKVDYFVYMFITQKQCFWFKPKPLVEYLDDYIKTVGYKTVKNKAWTSHGYTIDRELLKHLEIKI